MDDEYHSFPDPETLAFQALLDGFEEAVRAPVRKALSTARVVRRFCSDLFNEAQNALISRSIYDLYYQYDKSLDTGGDNTYH